MFNKSNKAKSMFSKKVKAAINNQKQYKIFSSKQFIGILMIVIFAFLMVVSIVQIRGLSTINSYTIGMLFGYYSYFIYIAFICFGLCLVFQIDIRIDKFLSTKFNHKFHFSWLPYLFFCIGVALVIESIIKAINDKTIFPGFGAFKDFFSDWWYSFTNHNATQSGSTSLLPGIMNSGIIVSFCMSMLVSWSGYIISIIIGLLLIAHFVFYIYYGSFIKIIKMKIAGGDPTKKEVVKKEEFEEYKTKLLDLSFEDQSGIVEKPDLEIIQDVKAKTTSLEISNSENLFPMSDPFSNVEDNQNTAILQEKTSQINLDKKLTKEIDLDSKVQQDLLSNYDTFDFELDIFDQTKEDDISIKNK